MYVLWIFCVAISRQGPVTPPAGSGGSWPFLLRGIEGIPGVLALGSP